MQLSALGARRSWALGPPIAAQGERVFITMRRPFSVLVAAAMTVGLAACSSGAATPTVGAVATPGTPATAAPTAAPTAVDYTGRTLTLWHYESQTGAMGIAWTAAIQQFKDTHPGVTVKFEQKGFEQIRTTAFLVSTTAATSVGNLRPWAPSAACVKGSPARGPRRGKV